MADTKVVNTDPIKRLQMDRLMAEARGFGLALADVSLVKPWGGYLRFTQESFIPFLNAYWLDVDVRRSSGSASVDPKVLLVAPQKTLSLQWHTRRGEIWRVIDGPVRILTGCGWSDLCARDYQTGEVLEIPPAKWHQLIGLGNWGRVAEIWYHVDPERPSNEADILRVYDEYGRVDQAADPATSVDQRKARWESAYRKLHQAMDEP